MRFKIEFAVEARDDLRALRKTDQVRIVAEIETQLTHEPHREVRNRKRLRPNPLADWELRVGKFRVLYRVDEAAAVVIVEAIGFKIGSVLFFRGQERGL